MQQSLPYVIGSSTSQAAARSMASRAETDRARILEFVKLMGEYGATADEVELIFEMIHQTASARVSELWHKHGLIKDSGLKRLTKSGRLAVVYMAA